MQRLFGFMLVVVLGWLAYSRCHLYSPAVVPGDASISVTAISATSADSAAPPPGAYTCDGRRYCSEMHSCEEATYFLQNCPNTKMDGDHDGIPCERQWCGN